MFLKVWVESLEDVIKYYKYKRTDCAVNLDLVIPAQIDCKSILWCHLLVFDTSLDRKFLYTNMHAAGKSKSNFIWNLIIDDLENQHGESG